MGQAKRKAIVAWIGHTDLNASRGETSRGIGPIAQAVTKRTYDEIHLLSDHSKADTQVFEEWLKQQYGQSAKIWPVELSGPTRFREIYEVTTNVLQTLGKDGIERQLTFHVSPGTPAMAAVWILLAKTKFPAELLESSREEGVLTISLPFEIAMDYIPPMDIEGSDEIMRLTQGMPPEVPEFGKIIHRCQKMKAVIALARRLAVEDVSVLIQGKSGTGKELFARAIHASSPRAEKPFIEVNCGAIPSELVESELFGHIKGAFTGALADKVGYLEAAHGGTLFLDEIGELPLSAQVKLLRAIQERNIQRVGSPKSQKVDFRIIAATNRTLIEEVNKGNFREDLFHRLAVGVLKLPSLKERESDLNLLIDFFLEQINHEREGKDWWVRKKLSAGGRNLLLQHTWPGNIRELSNTLCRVAIYTPGATIEAEQVQAALFPVANHETILNRPLGKDLDLSKVLQEVKRHYLTRAYEEAGGKSSVAYKLVGLNNAKTFANWLEDCEQET